MTETILFVDDDIRLVSALQRCFHRTYHVELALTADDALAALDETHYAVVVSDLQMPGMNGIELLTKVKERSPETVRILLTGQADLEAAINAVNEGCVFRFLQKPCPQELLKKTLDAGLAQYRLHRAEQDVLQETLLGTVGALTELLANLEPAAFGRAARIRWCVRKLCLEMKVPDQWQLEAAALLSQIGCIPVSGNALNPCDAEEPSANPDLPSASSQARMARRILERVPRLHTVAQIIDRQYDGFENTANCAPEEYVVRFGAQMLRIGIDFDEAISRGRSFPEAIRELQKNASSYNPEILRALGKVVSEADQAPNPIADVGLALPAGPGRPPLAERVAS